MRLLFLTLLMCFALPAQSETIKVRVFFDDDECPSKTRLLDANDSEDRCKLGSEWQADGVCVDRGSHTFKWMTKRSANAKYDVFPFEVVAESNIFAGPSNTCTSQKKGRGARTRYVAKCDATLPTDGTITYTIKAQDCVLDPRIIVTNAAITFLNEEED